MAVMDARRVARLKGVEALWTEEIWLGMYFRCWFLARNRRKS
jgi:hypothetical protein